MSKTERIGWIIDRDYINKDLWPYYENIPSRVGFAGTFDPEDGFPRMTREIPSEGVKDPVRFRLLDDDGEVYYGGAIDRSWLDGDEEFCFHPLDWGRADAGATELQYKDDEGAWRTL